MAVIVWLIAVNQKTPGRLRGHNKRKPPPPDKLARCLHRVLGLPDPVGLN
jgi:hypothetical protein